MNFSFYQYDINQDTWTSLNPAPAGRYNNQYRYGSSIVYGGDNKIYALKGRAHYNEFYAYDIITNSWEERDSLPFKFTGNRKKRVTYGGAMCYDGANTIYAIKGGGSNEFWRFNTITGKWSALETIPRLYKKSVPRSGAGITCADNRIWLLKGNKTYEFWSYNIHADKELNNAPKSQVINCGQEHNNSWKVIVSENNQGKIRINFSNPVSQNITMKIFDAQGRLIQTMNKYLQAGNYSEEIQLNGLPKGVYFYVLKTNNSKIQKKMLLLK